MSDRSFGQDIEEDGLCDAVRPDSDAGEVCGECNAKLGPAWPFCTEDAHGKRGTRATLVMTTGPTAGECSWCGFKPCNPDLHSCRAEIGIGYPEYAIRSCQLLVAHKGAHRSGETEWTDATTEIDPSVSLPLSLAQRILAALEDDATRTSARRALAYELLRVAPELRAVMPK